MLRRPRKSLKRKWTKYYEIAFSYRDIPAEVDFLEAAMCRYGRLSTKSILELASGNSSHLTELSRPGYHYFGLELNEEMICYSRKTIEAHGFPALILKGNMVESTIPEPVDCVLVFLGSFYIKNDEELRTHLKSVANSLRSRGLYIFDGVVSYFADDVRTQSWQESRDGVTVDVTYDPRWIEKQEGSVGSDTFV